MFLCCLYTDILLDVLLCSIIEHFYELCRILTSRTVSQNTNNESKFSAMLHNKMPYKRFIIQHAKFFFFVTSTQFVACVLRENLSNRSSGVQISRDICTGFGRNLYSTKCSWIIIDIP